jgi:hypothetical protein
VLVVRWWTNGCSLCEESAPALARLGDRAAVVAIYHPKDRALRAPGDIRQAAREIGMPGTLGVDPEWAVLDRWMPPPRRRFTSLTFLVDRHGNVHPAHSGGVIRPAEEEALRVRIAALESEPE